MTNILHLEGLRDDLNPLRTKEDAFRAKEVGGATNLVAIIGASELEVRSLEDVTREDVGVAMISTSSS